MMKEKQQVRKRRREEKCDDCFGVRKGVEALQHREERHRIYEVLFHTRELAAHCCREGEREGERPPTRENSAAAVSMEHP